ncbi:hypothetical protein BDR06DRAFT_730230 [Suillus hirtellus]|nr:hypothetical protein BDR06DRAFT_730230 [Suillus hirtellus]
MLDKSDTQPLPQSRRRLQAYRSLIKQGTGEAEGSRVGRAKRSRILRMGWTSTMVLCIRHDNMSTSISTEEKVGPMASPTFVHDPSLLLHQEPKPSPASTDDLPSPVDISLPLQDIHGSPAHEKSIAPFGVYLPQPTPQGSLVSHDVHGVNKENETVPEPALSPIKKPNDGSSTKVAKKKMRPGSAKNA